MMNISFRIGSFAALTAAIASAHAASIFGVTTGGNLVRFNSSTPGSFDLTVALSGLATGDRLVGLDFRTSAGPMGGKLYGLGRSGNLYTINTSTGAATTVASLNVALTGSVFGVDFNPTVDRLRVVSNTGQNLRINPDSGATIIDGNLNYAAGDTYSFETPNVAAIGYTRSFVGGGTTGLYGVDTALDTLVMQNPPNAGTLNTLGWLGVNATNLTDMDIYWTGSQDIAYASINDPMMTTSGLYSINLNTGAASLIGALPMGDRLGLIAAAPVPEPATMAALGLGALAALRRRRK